MFLEVVEGTGRGAGRAIVCFPFNLGDPRSYESRPESARAMSSKWELFSDPVASDRHEDLKEEEDLEDLEDDSSGGESGIVSIGRMSMVDMTMPNEWTRGSLPAGIAIGGCVCVCLADSRLGGYWLFLSRQQDLFTVSRSGWLESCFGWLESANVHNVALECENASVVEDVDRWILLKRFRTARGGWGRKHEQWRGLGGP